jgi:hypothetical protein
LGALAGLLAVATPSGLAAVVNGTAIYRPAARADAKLQLSEVSLPAGAKMVTRDPSASSSLRNRPPYRTGLHYVLTAPYAVDDHSFWRVSEGPAGVVAWIKAHPPAGSMGSQIQGASGGSRTTIVFRFGSYPRQVVERALVFEVTAGSGGGSAVRVDGVAEWLPVHPGWDQIPANARLLTATIIFHMSNSHRRTRSATLTSARNLSRIAGAIDRARAFPPRLPPPCAPEFIPETFRLTFQARRGGPVLARATGSFFCGGDMVVTIGGRRGPVLRLPGLIWKLASQVTHSNQH